MNLLNGGITFFSRYTLATLTSAAILGAGGVSLVHRTSASEPTTVSAESTSDPPAWMDDNGGSKPQLGQPCVSPGDCNSGYCVDGVCCASACTASCMACNVAGMAGTCSPVAEFDDDPLATPACVSPNAWCNGAGGCVKAPGQACSKALGCASGYCVDGVCCNSSCTGTCMSCAVAGNAGTCSAVPAGQGDLSASSPCYAPTWTCDGAGACKGVVGASCSTNAGCYSDYCDNGLCGEALPQWVWSQETAACAEYFDHYMRIGFTDIVARADESVFGVGTYNHAVMGLISGTDDFVGPTMHHGSGPHHFKADVVTNGQGGSLSGVSTYYRDSSGGTSCPNSCFWETSGRGPAINSAGGDVLYFYQRLFTEQVGWDFPTSTCQYGILSKFAAPQWSLDTNTVCAGYSTVLAGDDAGNVLAIVPPNVKKFDVSGSVVLNVPSPFTYPTSTVALAPSGAMVSAGFNSKRLQLIHANEFGTLLWSKSIPDALAPSGEAPVDLVVDANGNAIVSYYAYGAINLGNGLMPPLGSKDVILAKFNPQGNVMWAKRLGSSGFLPRFSVMRKTGADEIVLALSFEGAVDLGDGQIFNRTVVAKYDAIGNLVWRKDLAPLFPSPTTEIISLALAGHPSGAVFVGGSGYGPLGVLPLSQCPMNYYYPKPLRLFVAKYAP